VYVSVCYVYMRIHITYTSIYIPPHVNVCI